MRSAHHLSVPPGRSGRTAFWLAAMLALGCGNGCAGRTPAAAGANDPSPATAADAQEGVAVPFALCRGFGLGGTPCYPTSVDIGRQVISPCRERHRGHCELSGPRHTMACLLFPLPDGKECGDGSICKDGACVKP